MNLLWTHMYLIWFVYDMSHCVLTVKCISNVFFCYQATKRKSKEV